MSHDAAPSAASPDGAPDRTIFGHPTGLFTLFFAEMWERFSYYGMRALLVLYMTKGFLELGDGDAFKVYGAYTALVYATPFVGGLLADRLLGARQAVVIGGLLMAAGHLTMTFEDELPFFTALALLIVGNGFFKPNISTIVGSLYPPGSPERDGGFTIFYMGINLGAAMSPLLCGYVGETFGWHYGFGLATIGMMLGLAVFVMPTRLSQGLIMLGALVAGGGLLVFRPDNAYYTAVNVFVACALLGAGAAAFTALGRGGLPKEKGARPPEAEGKRLLGMKADHAVYLGIVIAVPVFALLVQKNEVAGTVLSIFGAVAFAYLILYAARSEKIARERLFVVLILTFFSMLFWSFFEQAGSSITTFTDRNVDRVFADEVVHEAQVGTTLTLSPTQEQLGYSNGDTLFTLDQLDALRRENAEDPSFTVQWTVAQDNVGMGLAERVDEIPASTFQSVNAVFILIFGLVFTLLWGFLAGRGLEPSTPVKFALGLLQLGRGVVALWRGAENADARGMVGVGTLILGYLLHTTGELCLSPVGLSMVTKLSPAPLVSTVMGAWFLATAFSNYLAGLIAGLTGVEHGDGDASTIPAPIDTVHVYGDVFGKIGLAACASAAICFALAPLLKKWMHIGVEVPAPEDEPTAFE